MNPLLLKFGLPAIVFAAIAFMKWSNAKATGEPIFPSVSNDATRNGKGGGGGGSPPVAVEGSVTPMDNTGGVSSSDYGSGDASSAGSSGSDIGTDYTDSGSSQTTKSGPNFATKAATPGLPGGGGGGFQMVPTALQPAFSQNLLNSSLPQLTITQPSTPVPVIGGGGHGTYAL